MEKDVGQHIGKGVKSTGLLSVTCTYGEEANGFMAAMKDGAGGGGLLPEYGISTPFRFIHTRILIRLQSR